MSVQSKRKSNHRSPDRKDRRWNAVAKRLNLRAGKIIGAEIGIWKGSMSQQLLTMMPQLFLYMIDRWCVTPVGDSYFQGSLQISRFGQHEFDLAYQVTLGRVKPFKSRYKILRMESAQAAEYIPDGSLDFCFIDADHSYEGVTRDIKAWMPKVKKGGWICGHDYAHPDQGNVKKAVDEAFGKNIELDSNRTWFHKIS